MSRCSFPMRAAPILVLSAVVAAALASMPSLAQPQAQAQATSAAIDAPVWRRWRDPTLERLLQAAHAHSPTLAQANARMQEAQALQRRAAAERMPTLDLGADARRTRADDRERAANGDGKRYANRVGVNAEFRWNIDLFGAGATQRDAAGFRADAEREAAAATRLQLSADIARAYTQMRAGDAQQAVERDLLQRLRAQDAIDAAMVAAGLSAAYDREALRAQIAAREAALRDGEAARGVALSSLRTLTAMTIEEIEAALAASPVRPECRDAVPEALPVDALERRFDLRIAEYQLRAASADARAAQRLRWPRLSLSGSGGWSDGGIGDLLRPSNLGAQLLAGLGLPLLDFGRLKADAQAARAREDYARAVLAERVLRAAEEADAALLEARRAQYTAARGADAYASERRVADVVAARWRAGLDSRRRALESGVAALERALAESAADQRACDAQIQLSLALALPDEASDNARHSPTESPLR